MTQLPARYYEDRAMRDAAKSVLKADVEHVRASLSSKGMASRVTDRIGDGARDVFEVAKVHVDENRGILAGFVALLVMWFGREPILDMLGIGDESDPDESDAMFAEGADSPDRTDHPSHIAQHDQHTPLHTDNY